MGGIKRFILLSVLDKFGVWHGHPDNDYRLHSYRPLIIITDNRKQYIVLRTEALRQHVSQFRKFVSSGCNTKHFTIYFRGILTPSSILPLTTYARNTRVIEAVEIQ